MQENRNMGGMFYSLKEVIDKLKKTEAEISALVKQGRLREFRDGPNLLFKIDEVEALLSDTAVMGAKKSPKAEEEEVPLVIEGEDDTVKAEAQPEGDTTSVAGEGINVLGETETELSLTEDTLAETKATSSGATSIIDSALSGGKAGGGEPSLEEIEENVNLDTFGSGSGLLDLSLQADDTSLGGILDEIYTPAGEEGKEGGEGPAVAVAAEADQILQEQTAAVEPEASAGIPAAEAAATVEADVEPVSDTAGNTLGATMFIPLAAIIYTTIVALVGQKNISSSVLAIKGVIWPIVIGGWVVTGLITAAAFMLGGKKSPKAPKKTKASKEIKEQASVPAEMAIEAEAEIEPEVPAESPQQETTEPEVQLPEEDLELPDDKL